MRDPPTGATALVNGDARMAGLARELADALSRYARERRSDDQKEVARLQTELCAARRIELDPPPAAPEPSAPPTDGSAKT